MDSIKKLTNALEGLDMIYKLLLCIPLVAIVWSIYRLCKSIIAQNSLGIVINAALIVIGLPFMWVADLICLLVMGKVWSLD